MTGKIHKKHTWIYHGNETHNVLIDTCQQQKYKKKYKGKYHNEKQGYSVCNLMFHLQIRYPTPLFVSIKSSNPY